MSGGPPLPGAAALRRGAVLLVLTAVALLALFHATDLDRRLADTMYDASSRSFPWRDRWFAAHFMHETVKRVLVGLGVLIAAVALLDALRPLARLDALARQRLRLSAAAVALVPLVIGLWKKQSALHCPWDIDRYGGFAPYLRLLDSVPDGWERGGCFPAGHASSALWLAGLCVWWLPHRPRVAAAVFAGGLAAGLGLGWVQQLRGAHFLSHTLWSVWAAAAVLWCVYALVASAWSRSSSTDSSRRSASP